MEIISRITAIILTVLLLPLLIAIGLSNLLLQGRPIIFRQTRIGKNFKPFIIYKFRTMRYNKNSSNAFNNDNTGQITQWGSFLRKTKLDELPQLFNVIKGDMRFIGPRPEVPEFVDEKSFFFLRKIKPGLSGYSSILFRNESEIWSMIDSEDPYQNILKIKVGLDKYYVQKKSFFEDLKLVGITIISLFIPKRMGHYLIIRLLKIEDDGEFNIRETISDVKLKNITTREAKKSSNIQNGTLFISDLFIAAVGFLFAIFIRSDFTISPLFYDQSIYHIIMLSIAVKLYVFYFFGMYNGIWKYTSLVDIYNIAKANFLGSLIVIGTVGYLRGFQDIPRSIFLIDFIFTFSFVCISRVGIRLIYSHLINPKSYRIELNKRVMIIGAGTTGEFMCRELINDSKHRMDPIGFLDDNKILHGKSIHGREVFGKINQLSDFLTQYDEAIICCPNAPRNDIYKIIEICKEAGKPFKTMPSLNDLVSGKLSVNQLKEVSIIDLLGRNEIDIDNGLIEKYIKGKRILITGAGGSIGSELVRQCLKYEPALMVMLDNSEFNLFNIEREVLSKVSNVLTKPLLSNIRDLDILSKVFIEYQPQVVFHAAAYKHVAMQEAFPWEAIKTNVHGTTNLVKLSLEHNIEKFVLVSTDKAVNPINVMGATKRLAELVCQGANNSFSTRFMAVRFGNVLGSSGSVIPIFQEQIRSGGPITITDPDMERYFMSVPEAAKLIIQAGSLGKGGEIFALDMGQPIKILDIANELIKLSGLEPDIDIPISFIGARPGEKQYEELTNKAELVKKTPHEKILMITSNLTNDKVKIITDRIMDGELAGHEFDNNELRQSLSSLVPEYNPLREGNSDPIRLKFKPEIEA
ncbi:MAG: polysaccharide biosynthesis protein [Candidatus Neomarinimicrobiota bacterium]